MALIITASDIEAEQSRTLASAMATDQAVQACTTLDASVKQQWNTFFAALKSFCLQPVCSFWYPWMPSNCLMATASTGDTMVAWEAQLTAWQAHVATCTNAPPALTPYNPTPTGQAVTQWLRYGAIIAGALGTAYVVSELVPLLGIVKAATPKKLEKKPA